MQKIDFVKNLETIVENLQSEKIVDLFKTGFAAGAHPYSYSQINPLLFLSKSNFDKIKDDNKYSNILNSLDGATVYQEQNLSNLVTILQATAINTVVTKPNTIEFFNFHNSLINTLKLAKDILISNEIDTNLDASINNGIIFFQILIEGEGLETEKYIKIFSALQELIQTISKILGMPDEKVEIVLLDSGSDTNVGIKSGVETVKSLFLIFKEIWDFIVNFKHYKQRQTNTAIMESLSIRAEISKKIAEGVITEKEGLEYIHMIKTRTDDLIGMKVLPKQIVMETNHIENQKLLEEFEGLKMLTNGGQT
jgi:hypothetical protein